MASPHIVIDSVFAAQNPQKPLEACKPKTWHYEERALNREAILEVLKRAARDPAFVARLTHHGSKALQDYDLRLEEKAALISGDISWIESHIGKLEAELRTWLNCRLQQEVW